MAALGGDNPQGAAPAASENHSVRQILRSSSIIGGASVANIVIGLARTKVAALLLGPAGVGLIGLLQNMVQTGSAVAGFGIASSSVRQLAEDVGTQNEPGLAATRRALFFATAILALLGGAVFWLLRTPLAAHVLGDANQAPAVGWLGVAVALTVVSNSQLALLNGVRRIGDMARINVFGAVLGTGLGIGALALWRGHGIVPYVVAAPLAGTIAGLWILRRNPSPGTMDPSLAAVRRQIGPMMRLGISFMLGAISVTAALLAVRAIVAQRLGTIALGHFSAAWMISMTYIGFVLQAMGTDYYPRLTAAIRDHDLVNRMVNEQGEIALLLAAPILIGMEGAAPWAIRLLYSDAFGPAIEVLRWQILGDVLKIVGWPLGFVILASGNGRLFVMTEALGVGVYAAFVWLAVDWLGLPATGMGFMLMYGAYLPVVYLLARRRTGFRWRPRNTFAIVMVFAAVALTALAGWMHDALGLGAGIILGTVSGAYSLSRLSGLGALQGRLSFMDKAANLTVNKLLGKRSASSYPD
ncbi:polysaccharide transporter, PST family [Sphingomonas gellani]|uniref:Polysaccharide transporter, PST family n=1 Tax=Sphingomonas gellani TaxID=1166340 RepID=A0A1H8I3U0_9SPHN|nr:O-antigen translocase [Sphingomonas gellani]SEN62992.1 polysaccharide transporter, PST family [Sphingomonas gellani]